MRIVLTIPDSIPETHEGRTLRAKMLQELVEASARINQLILRHMAPELPALSRLPIRFRVERDEETIPDVLTMLEQGYGDCAPLSAARIAELRENGVAANPKIYWRPERQPLPYHVQVRRDSGSGTTTIEDPARRHGMVGRISD